MEVDAESYRVTPGGSNYFINRDPRFGQLWPEFRRGGTPRAQGDPPEGWGTSEPLRR